MYTSNVPSLINNIDQREAGLGNRTTSSEQVLNSTNEPFQAFIVDQLTKIQEQNENLKVKIDTLEKEQEELYLSQLQKFENGFKNLATCVKDVAQLKDLFKEVVGIMTGERIRFLDHSNESVGEREASNLTNSTLLQNNHSSMDDSRYREYHRDRDILQNSERIRVKQENHGEMDLDALPPSNADANSPTNYDDEFYLNSITGAQREHRRDLENSLRLEQAMHYEMNRAIQSVHDVAREYYEGFPGKPSLLSLERRFGSTWRKEARERTLFAKRKCFINKINDVRNNPTKYNLPEDIKRNQAIKVIENVRLGNNTYKGNHCRLSLSQLYEYFSKKMDKIEDYSLILKNRGEPRRVILMRAREAELEAKTEDGDTGNSSRNTSLLSTSESLASPNPNDENASIAQEAYSHERGQTNGAYTHD